jgi:hypothetical protein
MANRVSQVEEAVLAAATSNVRLSQLEETVLANSAAPVHLSQFMFCVLGDVVFTPVSGTDYIFLNI